MSLTEIYKRNTVEKKIPTVKSGLPSIQKFSFKSTHNSYVCIGYNG